VSTVAGRTEAGYRDGAGSLARFDGPAAVAADSRGMIYVADSRNHCVRMVTPDGTVTTLAGIPPRSGYQDGPARRALLSAPAGLAVAHNGGVFVADTGNHRIRYVANGEVSTYAGAATPKDDLGRQLGGYRDGPAREALFRYPVGLAVDSAGALYAADAGNRCVRRISPAGMVTTLPTEGGKMQAPTELALAPNGQVWVADTAGGRLWVGPSEGPLRPWQPAGEAGGPTRPAGLALAPGLPKDGAAGLYVADAESNCLWLASGGRLTLAAGQQNAGSPGYADGPGDEARFACPSGLAAGAHGEVYVADFDNNCLRRVTATPPPGGAKRSPLESGAQRRGERR